MDLYEKKSNHKPIFDELGLKEPYFVYLFCFGPWLVDEKPPTSDDHNFFVRTPFQMLLDSMESPLSLESIHI